MHVTMSAPITDAIVDYVIARARSGALLSAAELRAVLQLSAPTFYRLSRSGRFDSLKTKIPVGRSIYSGTLVARLLDGERVSEGVWGRRTARLVAG